MISSLHLHTQTSALNLTGEDGRRKKPAAAAAATGAAAAAAPAPAAARIRLKLQSNPVLQKVAAVAVAAGDAEGGDTVRRDGRSWARAACDSCNADAPAAVSAG